MIKMITKSNMAQLHDDMKLCVQFENHLSILVGSIYHIKSHEVNVTEDNIQFGCMLHFLIFKNFIVYNRDMGFEALFVLFEIKFPKYINT